MLQGRQGHAMMLPALKMLIVTSWGFLLILLLDRHLLHDRGWFRFGHDLLVPPYDWHDVGKMDLIRCLTIWFPTEEHKPEESLRGMAGHKRPGIRWLLHV